MANFCLGEAMLLLHGELFLVGAPLQDARGGDFRDKRRSIVAMDACALSGLVKRCGWIRHMLEANM